MYRERSRNFDEKNSLISPKPREKPRGRKQSGELFKRLLRRYIKRNFINSMVACGLVAFHFFFMFGDLLVQLIEE